MTGQLQLTDEHVAVMRKTLEHVFAHPDEWEQSHWVTRSATSSCGTAYCFAGHAAITVAGGRPTYPTSSLVELNEFEQHISDAAQRLLGLDDGRAEQLFRATNSARRLAELCYLYSDGQVDLLHTLPEPTTLDLSHEFVQCDDAHAQFNDLVRYAGEQRVDLVTAAQRFTRTPL